MGDARMIFSRKNRLWDTKEYTHCDFCLYSSQETTGEGQLRCLYKKRRKPVAPEDSCKKFSYDPTKRKPRELPPLTTFDPKDFEL